MIRLSLTVALAGLLLSGCGQLGDVFAQGVAAEENGLVAQAPQQQAPPAGGEDVKTPLIRALIQTVDEAKGESSEVKDSLKQALREADGDLSRVLGGKSKMLIMRANRKPPSPVIGDPVRRIVKKSKVTPPQPAKPSEKGPEEAPAEKLPIADPEQPADAPSQKVLPAEPQVPEKAAPKEGTTHNSGDQSPMLRALMRTIDEDEGQSPEVKRRLKELLRAADKEMGGALSARAVRVRVPSAPRPARPVVREVTRGGVKIREFRPSGPVSE